MPRPSDASSERLPELDSLRGIAALFVVFYHVALTPQLSDSMLHRVLNALPTHPMFNGRLAVILFFVLSGMVLTRGLTRTPTLTAAGFFAFACRRAVRLCLPAAAALALSAALYMLLWDGPWAGSRLYGGWSNPPGLIDLTRQAMLIGADGDFTFDPALWSLVHELRLSLLLPLFVAIPAFRGPNGSLTLLCVALMAFGAAVSGQTAIEGTIQAGPTLLVSFRATTYFALPFLTGAAMSLGFWDRWRPGAEQRTCALAAALLLLCSDSDVAAVIASVLLILLSRHDGRYRDFLRLPALLWLGRISFSLYLAHMPVQLAVQHGLHRLLPPIWLEPLAIVLSLFAAWILHALAEEPAQRLSRRIGSRQRYPRDSRAATAEV